jgi:hypothetical protein
LQSVSGVPSTPYRASQCKQVSGVRICVPGLKFDMAAKRHKKHKNINSHLIISVGYETEIREF